MTRLFLQSLKLLRTYRIFLTLVASYYLHTVPLDVKTVFLNADMKHEVWMMPSENLEHMYEKLMAASDITPEERKMLRKHMNAHEWHASAS